MPESVPQQIGVAAESHAGETRVAATPANVRQLLKLGYEVVVESGAGEASGVTDDAYVAEGARIGAAWQADIVLKIITVRIDETLKRLDKRKKERDKRAAKRAASAPATPAPAQPSLAQQMTESPAIMPGVPKAEA